MIPEFTLLNGVLLIVSIAGLAFLYSGFRGLFLDEILIGSGILAIVWYFL